MAQRLRQPSLLVPFRRQWAASSQAFKLAADLWLWPESSTKTDGPLLFRVDSGAELTTISIARAEYHGWPVPPAEAAVSQPITTAAGRRQVLVRPGRIRVWWTRERTGYPFDWPALFVPDVPLTVPPLLGLGGVVTTCRWMFDGQPTPAAPFGGLTLDDTR